MNPLRIIKGFINKVFNAKKACCVLPAAGLAKNVKYAYMSSD